MWALRAHAGGKAHANDWRQAGRWGMLLPLLVLRWHPAALAPPRPPAALGPCPAAGPEWCLPGAPSQAPRLAAGLSRGHGACPRGALLRTTLRSVSSTISLEDPAMRLRLQVAKQRIRTAQIELRDLRDHLLDRGTSAEPLDRGFIGAVLGRFAPAASAAMRPLLDRALAEILETVDAEAMAALACGMALARLPHDAAWAAVAAAAAPRAATASGPQLTELAWAFATAGEQRPELFAALKAAMASHAQELEDDQRRTFAWACAEVGEHATELFGEPPVNADASASRAVLEALERLAHGGAGARALHVGHVPVVLVPGAVSATDGTELVRLVEEGGLWRPSSRRGARSADGTNARRTSQSALLSAPAHFQHPAVRAVRFWVASALSVPMQHVEALQMVRYNRGEEYGLHVDWGLAQDASMWLGGQRTATALLYLNSLPEGCGGETAFERLGLQVAPSAGAALLWPNVDAHGAPQPLVEHRAMPVLCDATKYALNVWVRGRPLPSYAGPS